MSRDNIVQARLNEREADYLSELAEELGVSESEAIRIVLYDSRFLYSDFVSFDDINIPPEDLVPEESSNTTGKESVTRVLD